MGPKLLGVGAGPGFVKQDGRRTAETFPADKRSDIRMWTKKSRRFREQRWVIGRSRQGRACLKGHVLRLLPEPGGGRSPSWLSHPAGFQDDGFYRRRWRQRFSARHSFRQ